MALWDSNCLSGTNNDIPTLQCLPSAFGNVIDALLGFAGLVAVILIILSGIKYINSGGDPKQVEGARKTLTWAIIGLVIIFASFLILNIVARFGGTNCILQFGTNQCQ